MRQCDFEVPLSVEGIYRGFFLGASTPLQNLTKFDSTYENNLITMSLMSHAKSAFEAFGASSKAFSHSHSLATDGAASPFIASSQLARTSFAGQILRATKYPTRQETAPPSTNGNTSKPDTRIESQPYSICQESDGSWGPNIEALSRMSQKPDNSTVRHVRSELASSLM